MELTVERIKERIKENLRRANTDVTAFLEGEEDPQVEERPQEEIPAQIPQGTEMSVKNDKDLLDYLLSLKSNDSFLKGSYREILGREPDKPGYNNFTSRLNSGASRTFVLYRLIKSKEAKSRGSAIKPNPGFVFTYYVSMLKWATKKIPVVSSLVLWPYRLITLPSRFHRLLEHFCTVAAELDMYRKRIETLSGEGRTIRGELGELGRRLDTETDGLKGKIEKLSGESNVMRGELGELGRRLATETDRLKGRIETQYGEGRAMNKNIAFVARKLDLLNYELKRSAGIDTSNAIKEISNINFSPDAYKYFAFENMFRGSRETVKERQSDYLVHMDKAHKGSKGRYVLDVGCGRGEFVELMADNNIPSKGIDINEENINMCNELGLDVELSDALQFMKSVKNHSLIGVTAFQVIEHLKNDYMLEFIEASFQKISAGGILIIETVNPYSLYSLRKFYVDPTHRNPIPPDTLKFLVEDSGFKPVEVKYSAPVPDEMKLKGDDENTRKLNELLFGYQDYAVIGRK